MNFEEMYKKVQDGTATEAEKALVEEKIHRISAILDDPMEHRPIIREADAETVRAARKSFNIKTTLKILAIVLCALALITGGTLWYVFGTANHAARAAAAYTREQAVEIAEEYVREYTGNGELELVVHDVDRRMNMTRGLRKAVYSYEVELRADFVEYEVRVDAKSGYTVITDVDYD